MKSFTTQIQVRFGHVDPAGIAYFPRIFDYIHEAFEDLWTEHVGQRYHHVLVGRRIGFPLVNSDVQFKSPLRFGDRPIVRITCFHLGRSSIGLHYVYTIDDRQCVDARMTTVCVDIDSMETMEIPAEFRPHFESIMEDA